MSSLNTAKSHRKILFGVGINDADYALHKVVDIDKRGGKRTQQIIWVCPFWKVWEKMLKRCYCLKSKARAPTYDGCEVHEDWHLFSNFKRWMEQQDWEGKVLDKDILLRGNKVYSAETCIFIPKELNNFLTDAGGARGRYLIGVSLKSETGKFQARCSNPFSGKAEHLGYFKDEVSAHKAWLERKLEIADMWAHKLENPKLSEVLKINILNRCDLKQDNLAEKVEELNKLQQIQEAYS